MVILAGKFVCGAALKIQGRVLLIPRVNRSGVTICLKSRDYGSSFPVRYIPKNSPKTPKLQTSSPSMNDFEDKDKHNSSNPNVEVESFDGGQVLGRNCFPKNSPKTKKLQTSSWPTKNFEDKDEYNGSDPNISVESSDGGHVLGRSCIPKNSPTTYSPPIKDFEIKDKYHGSDLNVVLESSDGRQVLRRSRIPKNSPETENLQTSSPLLNNFEDKIKHSSSDSNKLSVEYLGGEKNLGRSSASGEKFNQNQKPSNDWIFNIGPEVEEEIVHKWGVHDDLEDAAEYVQKLQGKEDDSEKLAFETAKAKQDAEKMAIAFLAKRAFTAVELRKKLVARKCPLHVVEDVVADLQTRGLINDCLLAETFTQSRFKSSSWGPRRIQRVLSGKGISQGDAEKAIKMVFKDSESGEQQESRFGMSKLSLDHLLAQASKQWLRSQDVHADKRKSRMIQWLKYRGFDWGVISFVLKKLESDYPS